MKKDTIETATVETAMTVTPADMLRHLFDTHLHVSLSRFADAVDAPYAAIRAKAKQPIEGQVFDPTATNYEAIMSYLLKRSPELNVAALDWDKLNAKSERVTKVLKESTIDFSVGKTYWLRYFKSNWTIVYETETHLCLMPKDTNSTQPKVMAKTTFIACGVKPEQPVEQLTAEEEAKITAEIQAEAASAANVEETMEVAEEA